MIHCFFCVLLLLPVKAMPRSKEINLHDLNNPSGTQKYHISNDEILGSVHLYKKKYDDIQLVPYRLRQHYTADSMMDSNVNRKRKKKRNKVVKPSSLSGDVTEMSKQLPRLKNTYKIQNDTGKLRLLTPIKVRVHESLPLKQQPRPLKSKYVTTTVSTVMKKKEADYQKDAKLFVSQVMRFKPFRSDEEIKIEEKLKEKEQQKTLNNIKVYGKESFAFQPNVYYRYSPIGYDSDQQFSKSKRDPDLSNYLQATEASNEEIISTNINDIPPEYLALGDDYQDLFDQETLFRNADVPTTRVTTETTHRPATISYPRKVYYNLDNYRNYNPNYSYSTNSETTTPDLDEVAQTELELDKLTTRDIPKKVDIERYNNGLLTTPQKDKKEILIDLMEKYNLTYDDVKYMKKIADFKNAIEALNTQQTTTEEDWRFSDVNIEKLQRSQLLSSEPNIDLLDQNARVSIRHNDIEQLEKAGARYLIGDFTTEEVQTTKTVVDKIVASIENDTFLLDSFANTTSIKSGRKVLDASKCDTGDNELILVTPDNTRDMAIYSKGELTSIIHNNLSIPSCNTNSGEMPIHIKTTTTEITTTTTCPTPMIRFMQLPTQSLKEEACKPECIKQENAQHDYIKQEEEKNEEHYIINAENMYESMQDKQKIISLMTEMQQLLNSIAALNDPEECKQDDKNVMAKLASDQTDMLKIAAAKAQSIETTLNAIYNNVKDLREDTEMSLESTRTRLTKLQHCLQQQSASLMEVRKYIENSRLFCGKKHDKKGRKKFKLFPWRK